MKKKSLRLYEGMYIISATLSEEARKKAIDKIIEAIVEKGGEIHKILEMGRRRLAYKIEKKREGFYYVVYFSIFPELVKDIWNEYLLHEDLIRFCTMQTEEIRENLEFKPLKEQS